MLNSREQKYHPIKRSSKSIDPAVCEYEKKRWLSRATQAQGGGQRSRRREIDHLPSAMCGRDGPAPSRSQDYSGRSRVTDDRRRGASLISFPPEMTADGHVTISRYSGMRPALTASASRKHFALPFVALHHHRMDFHVRLIADWALRRNETHAALVKPRDNKKMEYSGGSLFYVTMCEL